MTPRPCPHHPRALGATPGNCRECDREATTADHHAGADLVRDAIRASARQPRPDTDARRAAAIERARTDRLADTRHRADQEKP